MEQNCQYMKLNKLKKRESIIEIFILLTLFIIIFIFSSLQVEDMLSIWNQNDEFGTWQGGAWLLGLDWSEVSSANGFYGYGYGFILAFFIKFFGYNTVLMTHMAIYFQVFIHTSCIFVAWYCIKKMFPSVNAIIRIIAASVSILSIPDLFYNYMFFSECILRFLVWITFGFIVSYSNSKKWYKLLLINLIAIYAFSIHQRCILLVAMSVLVLCYESICYLVKNGIKMRSVISIILILISIFIFYIIEYKCAQNSYISAMYSANGNDSVGGNLLSERGYTVKSILKNVVFNLGTERIALQNMLGFIYYINAFDCGFVFYGFILCFSKIKYTIVSRREIALPYVYMSCMTFIGILLVVYQNANEWAYERVEVMHYGRYCSYLFAPMIMFGIISVLTETGKEIRRNLLIVSSIFLLAGLSTYNVLKSHNVTNLFAFTNACPGIKSVYFTENPFTATLYHTVLGVVWICIPALILMISKRYSVKKQYFVEIGSFIVIASVWINVANREWGEQYEEKDVYVTQTYDLQNVLKNLDEFAAFKSYGRYGSGLLQYNNPFSKIHIYQSLDEFDSTANDMLVVSQKAIEEMDDILQKYDVEYENDFYFVWKYESLK